MRFIVPPWRVCTDVDGAFFALIRSLQSIRLSSDDSVVKADDFRFSATVHFRSMRNLAVATHQLLRRSRLEQTRRRRRENPCINRPGTFRADLPKRFFFGGLSFPLSSPAHRLRQKIESGRVNKGRRVSQSP